MEMWETSSGGRRPCSWQGGWNQMIFKVPSNPNNSVFLCTNLTFQGCWTLAYAIISDWLVWLKVSSLDSRPYKTALVFISLRYHLLSCFFGTMPGELQYLLSFMLFYWIKGISITWGFSSVSNTENSFLNSLCSRQLLKVTFKNKVCQSLFALTPWYNFMQHLSARLIGWQHYQRVQPKAKEKGKESQSLSKQKTRACFYPGKAFYLGKH